MSKVVQFWVINKFTRLESGSYEYRKDFVESIPVAIPTAEQALILESFTDDSYLNELNALVYEMYGLTPAEIELVERLTAVAHAADEPDNGVLGDEDVQVGEA